MNGTSTIIIVFCSLTAYEELSESSQEDIKVDERRRPSFCSSFLPQNICLSLWGIALTRFSSHFCIVCLEKNFAHQSLIYGNFDVSCPSIWLRTQMMMIGLQNTSSLVEQCLQLIYFFISRSVLYPFFSFFFFFFELVILLFSLLHLINLCTGRCFCCWSLACEWKALCTNQVARLELLCNIYGVMNFLYILRWQW